MMPFIDISCMVVSVNWYTYKLYLFISSIFQTLSNIENQLMWQRLKNKPLVRAWSRVSPSGQQRRSGTWRKSQTATLLAETVGRVDSSTCLWLQFNLFTLLGTILEPKDMFLDFGLLKATVWQIGLGKSSIDIFCKFRNIKISSPICEMWDYVKVSDFTSFCSVTALAHILWGIRPIKNSHN